MNWFAAMAFIAGALIPVQAAINASLRTHLSHPMHAVFVSFAVGTVGLLFYCLAIRQPLPTGSALASVPWWGWTAGLLGAFFIYSSIVSVPKLGAAAMLAIIVAGQIITSLVMDHYGAIGLAQQPITLMRVVGAALVIGGVVLT